MSIKDAMSNINKQYGKGSIMKLTDRPADVPCISTGCISLDLALGGGIPRGRIIEAFGQESAGKSTLALMILAQAQKNGVAAYIDAEHALDPKWAKKLGVNVDTLLISQPDSGEQALDITEQLIKSNSVDFIVVDSVAALVLEAELTGEMGQSHIGFQARLMSQALRKLTAVIGKTKTCLLFINQLRMKIGVMFGSPFTTTGGNALKFYSSVRLDIRRVGTLKQGDDSIGNRVRVKVVKNKVSTPFKQAEFDLMFDSGISVEGDVLDLAVEKGIAQKRGAWFNYGSIKLGQGRENAKQFIKEHTELLNELKSKIMTT